MKPELSVVIPYDAKSASAAAFFAGALVERPRTQVVLSGDAPLQLPKRPNLLTLSGHQGKGASLKAAVGALKADVTVVQDADDAYSLDALPSLTAPISAGHADVVFGRRTGLPLTDAALGRFAAWVSERPIADPLTGQRAFRTPVLREVSLTSRGADVDSELLIKLAAQLYRFIEVPISLHHAARAEGYARFEQARSLLKYATTLNDADNAHEGYNTLTRMEGGAPNYNRWLGERFNQYAGQRVLEIGAGLGTITELLAPGREKVVALEVDEFYVKRLRNRFRDVANVEPYLSDVALADWQRLEAEAFDSIVLSNVLEHIPDDAGAVRRFRQILKPGGRVVILVPALPLLYGSMDEAVGHYRRYTPQMLRGVLEDNGFSIETLEWMNLAGVPGWLVNSRLFKRRSVPPLQLRVYDTVAPLLARLEARVKLPLGMSLFCVARR